MTIAEIKSQAEAKMAKSLEALKADLQKIRTGRAHPGILDHIHIDYYGSMVPINQVANVSLLDARTISVQPWEKGMGAKIEKAIRESDLGLNPSTQGDLIRVPMPALTEERRKRPDQGGTQRRRRRPKVAVRNLRRDANDHAEEACSRTRKFPKTTSVVRSTKCKSSPIAPSTEIDRLVHGQGSRSAWRYDAAAMNLAPTCAGSLRCRGMTVR